MINKSVDWKQLNGKSLKIFVAENDGAVIGIDEETNKAYLLKQETPTPLQAQFINPMPTRTERKWMFGL